VRIPVRIRAPPFNPERCIANDSRKHHHPPHTTLSSVTCSKCGTAIKLKHVQVAREYGHRPPDLCYACLCGKKRKKPSRQRKIERAKAKQREREKAKRGEAS
jgi:hypothetical protein